ncbi:MAG: hypothetical protein WC774_01930 [Candidatus Gracilibacteria bacterium]
MEETNNTEKKANFIELSQDPQNIGNIFTELSGEIGELDFNEKALKEAEKKEPILIAYAISGKLFILGVLITILLSIDVYARSTENNSLFTNLPICPYLSYGIENYDNIECKTPLMISAEVTAKKEKLEEQIITNLTILVPKLMQSMNITSSPKVQFIQEHTGNSRVSITETIRNFLDIKNKTSFEGADIECQTFSIDEKGVFSISCKVYGGPLLALSGLGTKTSRETAIEFLTRLNDAKSNFQLLSYPKVLDISEFSSAEGFKTVFSTQTSLNLKLQYLAVNKM